MRSLSYTQHFVHYDIFETLLTTILIATSMSIIFPSVNSIYHYTLSPTKLNPSAAAPCPLLPTVKRWALVY